MLARLSFLQNESPENQYQKMRSLFLSLLEKTEDRCVSLCKKRYNQERNWLVTVHPEIESNYIKIGTSKKRILAEIDRIDKRDEQNPLKRIESLKFYAQGLSQAKYNLLFMTIFSGELSKRWVPHFQKPYEYLEMKEKTKNNIMVF